MKITDLEVFNFKGAFRGMRAPMESWDRSDSIFEIVRAEDADDFFYEVAYRWAENEEKPDDEEVIEKYVNWLHQVCHLRWAEYTSYVQDIALIGPKDLELAQKLIRAGGEHRKFLRQIIVSFDLTAPIYFWKEFDTYKVGTTSNSTSTMHKLASTPITLDCFETDDYNPDLIYLSGVDDRGDSPYNYDMQIKDIVESEGLNTYDETTIIEFLEELREKYNETKNKSYWKELIRWLPESWLQTRTITMSYENILNIIHQRSNHKLSEWHWLLKKFRKELPYAYELLFFLEDERKVKVNED